MNWPYIAGFFDGEGNVGIPLGHNTVLLNITQAGRSGLEVLEEIKCFLGIHGIKSRVYQRKVIENRQVVYMLWVSPTNSMTFLSKVMPYLRVKRTKSQDIIRIKTLFPSLTKSAQGRFFRRELSKRNNAVRVKPLCPKGHTYVIGPSRRWCRECMRLAYESRKTKTST